MAQALGRERTEGERLRVEMTRLGLRFRDLVRLTDIHESTLVSWLNGRNPIPSWLWSWLWMYGEQYDEQLLMFQRKPWLKRRR